MSACPDCPKYGNPAYTGPRQVTCCMEKSREATLEETKALLSERMEADRRQGKPTPTMNRAARRRAAKLAR